MFEAKTQAIHVRVEPQFLDEQSSPDDHHFFWAYYVEIENRGVEPVQLCARHWRITDGRGATKEVMGEGVVGEQPTILPGETYSYTSGAPLGTPSGFMGGHYQMERQNGEGFLVDIPIFSLDSPYDSHVLN
ncbi:MAG: protein ApaG [Rhodomicrobium sp.]|jgi:ApaG protein|nr:MAG: protein ApaG [Rhodomicrobium sp.]